MTRRWRPASHYNGPVTPLPIRRLGAISVARFLRDYWQRKPLLVRAAFPEFTPPVDRDRLFELAAGDNVESRLVVRQGRRWTLREGPFSRRALPPPGQPRWTLLVQGLDGVDANAHALLSRFRFVPDARLDDLMASYASDGCGVGPHVDNYDVFLLQTQGRRRWRISRQRDLHLQTGQPLRLLAGFRATREWILEPGDLLYLPPGVAHDGVALGECITYSIGFRAPSYQELLDPWLARFAAAARIQGRYGDAGQRVARHPAELPAGMVARVHAALARARPTQTDTERFLLEYLSEPKPHVVFDRPARTPAAAAFARAAQRRGVVLDLRSRMLTRGMRLALNGELHEMPGALRPQLRQLADRRTLSGRRLSRAPVPLLELLRDWLQAGWLHLGRPA